MGLTIFNVSAVVISFIVSLVLSIALGTDRASEVIENIYFAMIMGVVPMYCISLPMLWAHVRKMPSRIPTRQDFGVKSFITLIPVAIFLMSMGNYIGVYLNTVISAIKGEVIENTTIETVSKSPLWLTIILVIIIGPLVEEFIFRKLMIDKLSRYGYLSAILLSSLAFGLFHGNLYQFFYAFFVGILLGYIYVKSGNWLLSALMHALVNVYGGILSEKMSEFMLKYASLYEQYAAGTLADTAELSYYAGITTLYSYFHIAMMILGGIIFFNAARRKVPIIEDRKKVCIPKGRRASCIFLNTGSILFILSSLAIFAIQL